MILSTTKGKIGMKNALLLTLFILCSIQLYGQEVQIQLSEYDKLRDRKLTDSLAITTQKSKIEGLEEKIKELEKEKEGFTKESRKLAEEINKLKSEISKVEKSELKTENESLIKKVEILTKEVTEYKKTVQDKELKLEEIKAEYESKLVAKKEEGIQLIKKQLVAFYDKPLDELVKITTKANILRDLALVGNDPGFQEKLQNLQVYHDSKIVLTEKYDAERVLKVVEKLKAMGQTEGIKKSIELLNDYNLRFKGLQETIDNLIRLDSESSGADNEVLRNRKFEKILSQLTTYFYEYELKLNEYPYLSDLINEIIQKKQIEIDVDLTYIKEKMK